MAGAAQVFRQIARQAVKLVPGPGTAVSSAVAAAGTKAIGEAAIAYYIKDEDFETIRKSIRKVEIDKDDDHGFTIRFNKDPFRRIRKQLKLKEKPGRK